MKISDKQKALFQHAAWSAGATGTAAVLGWLGAHQADLVSKRYEFVLSLAIIPGLEYARKWFKSRDKKVTVIFVPPATPAPAPVVVPVPVAPVVAPVAPPVEVTPAPVVAVEPAPVADPTALPDAAPAGEVAPGDVAPAA